MKKEIYMKGVGISVLYAVLLEFDRKCGKLFGKAAVFVAFFTCEVGSVAYKTVVCLLEQATLFCCQVAIVSLVNGFYACE